MQQVQQISFAVPVIVAQNLARRAGPLNIRATEYARRLFEAAYAARIADERGQEPDDMALDRAVRNVFLLADCEPEYIADALHLPLERVQRILDGWRQAARELVEVPAQAVGAPPAPAAAIPPPARSKAGGPVTGPMTAEEISVIRKLWREGKKAPAIAEVLGCDARRVANFAFRNRDICPTRRGG